jgi:hypothetical protein
MAWCGDGDSSQFFLWGKRLSVIVLVVLSGCGAGGGDEDGDNSGGGVLQPTLPSIQTNIFGPICAQAGCHVGASAQQGLMLDSVDNSFQDLVGTTSTEAPSLLRVNPGNPDSSYLVHKIEGRATIVGAQMPLNQPALSGPQIEAIRTWIQNGATQ